MLTLNFNRRYLRARRWVVEDAYQQFKDTEEWRKANDLDVLYNTIDLDAYEQSRRLVCAPSWDVRSGMDVLVLTFSSTPNGQAVAIVAESPSTSSR